jgi:hypothetical protein
MNMTLESIKAAMRADASVTMIGEARPNAHSKRLLRLVRSGRTFINGEEVFHLSRRQGRKLAYRWKGSKRGKRIAAWLQREVGRPRGLQAEKASIDGPDTFVFKQ